MQAPQPSYEFPSFRTGGLFLPFFPYLISVTSIFSDVMALTSLEWEPSEMREQFIL